MNSQRGAVLVLALIFLLLLTLIALTTSSRSLLQERMAGAMRNAQQAEWSAENALRGVEWNIFSGNASVGCYNSSNPSTVSAKVTTFRQSSVWLTDGATEYKGAGVAISAAPFFCLRELPNAHEPQMNEWELRHVDEPRMNPR